MNHYDATVRNLNLKSVETKWELIFAAPNEIIVSAMKSNPMFLSVESDDRNISLNFFPNPCWEIEDFKKEMIFFLQDYGVNTIKGLEHRADKEPQFISVITRD